MRNLKFFKDSGFSFWATESKPKRGFSGISGKGNSSQKKITTATSFEKNTILNSFDFEKFTKIWGKRAFFEYWDA